MARPAALTGEMAGDVGFDPLGFAKDTSTLLSMREAEIKHARLAMLAAAGWPISELMDKGLAKVFGLSPLLDSADRVPSLLNGGLGKVSPFYWGAVIGLSAAIDLYGMSRKNTPDYTPGGEELGGVARRSEASCSRNVLFPSASVLVSSSPLHSPRFYPRARPSSFASRTPSPSRGTSPHLSLAIISNASSFTLR